MQPVIVCGVACGSSASAVTARSSAAAERMPPTTATILSLDLNMVVLLVIEMNGNRSSGEVRSPPFAAGEVAAVVGHEVHAGAVVDVEERAVVRPWDEGDVRPPLLPHVRG